MTKDNAKKIGEAVKAAMDTVARDLGLTVKFKGGSYSDTDYSPRFTFTEAGGAKTEFERNAALFGLAPTDFGKTFRTASDTYTISGLKLAARKMPVLATRADGRVFKFSEAVVLAALGKPARSPFSGPVHLTETPRPGTK